MIVGIIILIVLGIMYNELPFLAKLVIMLINTFVPDPIPFVDEAFMTISTIAHVGKLLKLAELNAKLENFKDDHPILFALMILLIIIVIIGLPVVIFYFFF